MAGFGLQEKKNSARLLHHYCKVAEFCGKGRGSAFKKRVPMAVVGSVQR